MSLNIYSNILKDKFVYDVILKVLENITQIIFLQKIYEGKFNSSERNYFDFVFSMMKVILYY